MPRQNKQEDAKDKPVPVKAKRILVSEYDRVAETSATPTLGLADVIYENLAAEEDAEKHIHETKPHSAVSKTNSYVSKTYSTVRKVLSNSPKLGFRNGKSLAPSPKANRARNQVGPAVEDLGEIPGVNGYLNDENSVASVPPLSHQLNRKRALTLQEPKKEAKRKKKTSGSLRIAKPAHSNEFPRRESRVFLLPEPSDSSVVYDTVQDMGITPGLPGLSSSPLSATSSMTTSILNDKALLSPEEAWLSSVEARLRAVACGVQTLTLPKFKEALQAKKSFFVDRCFQIFDHDSDGVVNLQALIKQLRALVYGSQTEKIRFLFNIYNIRGTGKLVKSEVHEVLKSCIEESKLQFSTENLQALTDALVTAADKDRDGQITFEELRNLVERHPTIAENLAVSTIHDTSFKKHHCGRHFSKTYIQNNLKKIIFFFVYFLINCGLGVVNGWRFRNANTWLLVARICGLMLDFNCTFIVVLMLRRLITSLRATVLVKVLPFDQHIMFHKICGYMIAIQSLIHTAAHIGNAGVALCVVLFIMTLLSLPFTRRTGWFEVFYWSHKLYLVMWVLLIIHAKDFWKWFLVPGLIFVMEAISRLSWVRSAYMGRTYIESVCLLPSEVTQIVISRPPGFNFKPGDYVFIQIPAIAKYEWHPFTISSAPEQLDTLWLHIRSAGFWTKSLHEYFINYLCEDVEAGTSTGDNNDTLTKANLRRRASSIAWAKQKPLKARRIESNMRKRVITKYARVLCHIDGPYGTPSRHIFEAEHAVLIGSGIGVTPFASILQSIVNQFKASCVNCPKCSYSWCDKLPASVMNLKKVDFIWINRDQRHFEWFVSLLSRMEREQKIEGGLGHILDMHMYMTSAPPKTDMKGLGLQLALDLIHENERTDLITGLQTRTQAGRPDFDVLFRKLQVKAKGRVTVFFCGSPLLGKTVKHFSHKYGFAYRHEYF